MADLAAPPEPGLRMTRQEFRRWAETQSTGRFERIEGTVVAMAPERADHNDLKMQVWLALVRRSLPPDCPATFTVTE